MEQDRESCHPSRMSAWCESWCETRVGDGSWWPSKTRQGEHGAWQKLLSTRSETLGVEGAQVQFLSRLEDAAREASRRR
jgi:hypothetical protein